jgi:ABC-type oligopeptide transport system substrate-binding subunit
MSIMDKNEETMAQLNMIVNEWRQSQEDDETSPVLSCHATTDHWKIGSADAQMSSICLETLYRDNTLFRDFNARLQEYLASCHPKHPMYYDQNIQVSLNQV